MSAHYDLHSVADDSDTFIAEEQGQAIHVHLHTQFAGIIAKLQQELSVMLQLEHNDMESLDELHNHLQAARYNYQMSETCDLPQAIEQFCTDCNDAITHYKTLSKIYQTNSDNDMSLIQINHVFDRFIAEIHSVIHYVDSTQLAVRHRGYPLKNNLLVSLLAHFLSTKKSTRYYP